LSWPLAKFVFADWRLFAVHIATVLVLRPAEGEVPAVPELHPQGCAVLVVAGRLDRADLKEGSRAKDTVVVIPEQTPVNAGTLLPLSADRVAGGRSILGGPVTAFRHKLLNDGCCGAHPHVELANSVRIQQVDLYVFVATRLALGGIGLAQKVLARAVSPVAFFSGNGLRRRFFRGVLLDLSLRFRDLPLGGEKHHRAGKHEYGRNIGGQHAHAAMIFTNSLLPFNNPNGFSTACLRLEECGWRLRNIRKSLK